MNGVILPIVDLVGGKLREVLRTETIGIRWYDDQTRQVSLLYEVERGQRIHPAPRVIVPGGPVERLSRTRQPVLYPTRADMRAAGLRAAGLLRVGAEECLSAMRVPIVRQTLRRIIARHNRYACFLFTRVTQSVGRASPCPL